MSRDYTPAEISDSEILFIRIQNSYTKVYERFYRESTLRI